MIKALLLWLLPVLLAGKASDYPKSVRDIAIDPIKGAAGGLYLRIEIEDGPAFRANQLDSRETTLYFYDVKRKSFWFLKQMPRENSANPNRIWNFQNGDFLLIRASLRDENNIDRVWTPQNSPGKPFKVFDGAVANLGILTLSAVGKYGLDIDFDMRPRSIEIKAVQEKAGVESVFNSYSGYLQKVSKYRSRIEVEEVPSERKKTTLATYKILQTIGFSFDVNLFNKNPVQADAFKKTLQGYRETLERCYKNGLAESPELKGDLVLSFVYSRVSERITQVVPQRGSMRDPGVVSCINSELRLIPFYIRKEMVGLITFEFDVSEKRI